MSVRVSSLTQPDPPADNTRVQGSIKLATTDSRVMRALRVKAVRHGWMLRGMAHVERDGWRALSACRGRASLFHGGNNDRLNIARAICESCPVRLDCLAACHKAESRLDPRYFAGVFGGLSANERRDVAYVERRAS